MYRNVRILIAEDNDFDVLLLKRAFAKAGFNPTLEVVTNGDEAIKCLRARSPASPDAPPPHLLLLDLKMPFVDGFGVLSWLRQEPGLRQLPVIVFSSSDEPRDIDRAHELGANGYTVKPNNSDDLLDTVQSLERYWLRKHRFPSCTPLDAPSPSAPAHAD